MNKIDILEMLNLQGILCPKFCKYPFDENGYV